MDDLLKIRDVGVVNPVDEFHPDIPAAIVLLMGLCLVTPFSPAISEPVMQSFSFSVDGRG